jgi:hypothetical protein
MGIEEVWSVYCGGVGVLNVLSGLEPERKQRKGASDVVWDLWLGGLA